MELKKTVEMEQVDHMDSSQRKKQEVQSSLGVIIINLKGPWILGPILGLCELHVAGRRTTILKKNSSF